ncbi:MAG: ATP-dependent DNA helicase RecG [Thiothrix lacustris]|uniref:ATP-dependent DNA helicase RecG n=1 Tax=Thiothrix lacustris TaxID=525917 RepID=A0A1Y1QXF1_9GAMM|nr:MAG: ATP-dependent DNA helicase RecG [Thiothrix lacustris]
MDWSVEQLFQELLALDEHPRIEAKRASEIGKSVMQTVCAFANEPGLGGGFLLLGVSEPNTTHSQYWVEGVNHPDQLLGQLQNNCRQQFEQPVAIHSQHKQIDGQLVVGVYVPEFDPSAKPCRFAGKPDKQNKRKTGVWRRGLNGDYECTERELEPILLAKSGLSYEQTVLPDAEWDDLDLSTLALYRQLRARVKPHAEELQVDNPEMLRALNLVRKVDGQYKPNLAGLLLFGKPVALRRLLPAVRVDYVRINGTEWVENAEQRFVTTLDLREPLIRMIPRLEATILDDMPRYFRLQEGETQRSDQPLLPYKVVREAVVNALMHRDYQVNQPILVVRYSNRLEIRNPGYSLKPEHELGEMGSVLRNPFIAAVLYDLDFAETKGSGIATMRRFLQHSSLTMPVFSSNRESNQFIANYLLHQLMGEEQLAWLQHFAYLRLSDNEAKALILAKETGIVDNAALRSTTGLDTLAASQVLGRLCKTHGLLNRQGAGSSTYYSLNPDTERLNHGELSSYHGELLVNHGELLHDIPSHLRVAIEHLPLKPRKETLYPIILELCATQPRTAEALGKWLKRDPKTMKGSYLNALIAQGLLEYQYADAISHPEQAYQTTDAGRAWLAELMISG